VLEEIRRRPGTADEVAAQLGRDKLAVRPRVSELRRLGFIRPTDERRRNRSRCNAMVWRAATPAELAAAPMAST
jgi:DNA-binding IclR family transcriptional regulator